MNKDADTCYSFWMGGSLHILGALGLANDELSKGFSMSCQSAIGGLSKCVDNHPDVLHTYLGLAGLSLMGAPGMQEVDPCLNMTKRAAKGFLEIYPNGMLTARQWHERNRSTPPTGSPEPNQ